MQSTKKQHYVPRLYLKQWVDSNERIWCLDREKGCIFNPNVMGVAQKSVGTLIYRNYRYKRQLEIYDWISRDVGQIWT